MLTHVKVIAWLQIIYGLFIACIAVLTFGGILVGSMFSGSLTGMIGGSILGGFVGLFLGARGALSVRNFGTSSWAASSLLLSRR